jgi:hypothetical protein
VVVICGALLKKCQELLERGIHPTVISDSFNKAANKACEVGLAYLEHVVCVQHSAAGIACFMCVIAAPKAAPGAFQQEDPVKFSTSSAMGANVMQVCCVLPMHCCTGARALVSPASPSDVDTSLQHTMLSVCGAADPGVDSHPSQPGR